MKRRLEIDWKRDTSGDFSASLKHYERYLRNIGFRDSTIESYVGHICRYSINLEQNLKPDILYFSD